MRLWASITLKKTHLPLKSASTKEVTNIFEEMRQRGNSSTIEKKKKIKMPKPRIYSEVIRLFNPPSACGTLNLGEVQHKPFSRERVNLDFCLQTKTNRDKISYQRQKWYEFPPSAGITAHLAQHYLYHSVENCPSCLSKGQGWFILLTQGESRLHKTKSYKSQGEPRWKPKHSQHLDVQIVGTGERS